MAFISTATDNHACCLFGMIDAEAKSVFASALQLYTQNGSYLSDIHPVCLVYLCLRILHDLLCIINN